MKKVIILYNKLFHYRIPIFNLLAKKYELTVLYSYPAKDEEIAQCEFNTVYLPVKKIMGLYYHRQSIKRICKEFDVVIAYGQITYIDYSCLAFVNRPYRLLFWSIGAPASYSRRYGEGNRLYFKIEDCFEKHVDALIFYSEKAKEMHIDRGFDKKRLFVANNTVKVEKVDFNVDSKNDLLFIGTLYLEKGLQDLLNAYKAAYKIDNSVPRLIIVGGGKQFQLVKDWIISNNLEQKIEMLGPIYNRQEKAKIFQKSIACISPNQAGLSVLESMGYGVPYITNTNAITGGESFNIQHEINGVLLEDVSKLKDVILDIAKNKEKYIKMGEKAYSYYWSNRTPDIMAKGIIDAVEFTLEN